MNTHPVTCWDDVFMNAAFEPNEWLNALDLLARHTGASHGQLIGIGGGRDVSFNLVSNFATSAIEAFDRVGGHRPDLNFRIAATQRELAKGYYDKLLYEKHYDNVACELRSNSYVDLCREFDIPFGCQTNLVVDGFGLVGLATLRKQKEGRTTPQSRAGFSRASQAARRAVRLQERLEGEQARFLAGAFEAIGICAFLIDRRGALLAHTARAEELLSDGCVNMVGGRLCAPGKPVNLQAAIQALITDEGGLQHVRLQIDRPEDHPPLLFEGFRMPRREWSFGRLPHAVLVASPPRRDRAGVAAFVMALYQLTSAEADIALRLLEGKSRSQIQADRDVTALTLKAQIRSIYAKCGIDNEGELMRLLSGMIA